MTIRVGINGFGRIGRMVCRVLADRPDEFEVVGINDLGATDQLVNLLKYDSVQGRFNGKVLHDERHLIVNGRKIPVFKETDPRRIPWDELDVNVALESTGAFRKRSSEQKAGYDSHLEAGAQRVVLSAPAKDEPDLTVVLGVNDHQLQPKHRLISNASCTISRSPRTRAPRIRCHTSPAPTAKSRDT